MLNLHTISIAQAPTPAAARMYFALGDWLRQVHGAEVSASSSPALKVVFKLPESAAACGNDGGAEEISLAVSPLTSRLGIDGSPDACITSSCVSKL